MEREHSKTGTYGWIGLALGVAAFDLLAKETLSEAVDRALVSHKLITLGAIAVTAGHLANAIPQQVDPFHQFLVHIKG